MAVERKYYIQWKDPTARKAVDRVSSLRKQKRPVRFNETDNPKAITNQGLTQYEIDHKIHGLRQLLKEINNGNLVDFVDKPRHVQELNKLRKLRHVLEKSRRG